MSSLPRIEAATSRATLPESTGAASGTDAPGSEFAEVMRSVFSPAHASTSIQHHSAPSVSSRSQSDRSQSSQSQSSSGKYSSLGGKNASSEVTPKSAQANQVRSGDSSAKGADGADENSSTSSEISSPGSVQSGDGSTPTPGQSSGSVQSEEIATRFSGTTAKGNSGSATRVAKLSVIPARKQPPTAGSVNTNEIAAAAVSSAITANPAVTTVHILKVDAAGAKDATEQQSVAESVKGGRFLLDEVGISSGGIESLSNPAAPQQIQAAHAKQGNDATPTAPENSANTRSTNSSSGSNQDVGSVGSAGTNQAAGSAGDSSSKNSANGSNSSVDPSADMTSSGASATGAQGIAGNNDPSPDTKNASAGNASSTHSANSTGTSSSASALPVSTVAAKTSAGTSLASMPPGTGMAHENAVGAGSSSNSSAFFASTHSSVAGNLGIPSASSSAGGRTSSDTFAALDSAASGERGVLLHASSHQVSVGITDPSLGWVEVRAERIAGQVTAALATNSAASHAALTSILPSMATYLQEHHSGVQQLHVETGLAGGQPGTGSQGQPSPQSDARSSAENTAIANPVGDGRTTTSQSAPIAAARVTSGSVNEHRFSIHA